MSKISHRVAKVEGRSYIVNYRDVDKFIEYCKKCDRYNTCWSCPPFNFDTDAYLSDFDTAYIIGTKILIDKETIDKNRSLDKSMAVSSRIMDKVRSTLDKKLLEIERDHPECSVFFAGSCRICSAQNCMRGKGKTCIEPDKIRPSLEAFGFDMARTSAEILNIEMKWMVDGVLPEYFTLVSGLFSKNSTIKESDILRNLKMDRILNN